ncbi:MULTISPECIES: DUF5064 family protein [Pseudomonas]|uniref:Acetyl-CoA carboxylase n=2 Tax=Pseudomonas TaxID=286 RepID=Q3K7X8_PSEPF|nr:MULTISPECIES: DUF5064 family protein [Pseudomonas]NKF28634.1 DUF5064 family protein [Pseudomonas sp. BG5]PNB80445.1 DUF5064 domain-containing protein [Pseudomonas sp. FW305-BF6]ABA76126.1 conserved hypothetical protein [Pseudomonas fluorescens Pf0-1]AMQ86633.1 DUF5064 domain-containing protein [Pseudomonas glycinae]AWA41061.1 DUF5064 domain-containing protein [Pseudomonas fluorescens]
MAQFEPGHLHIERHALTDDDVNYNVHLDYEVFTDPQKGKGIQFTLHGSMQGKEVNEPFFLPKEEAYNFARNVTQIAEKYGIPKSHSQIGSVHKHYDLMFEDIRMKLNMKSGDPVNPEHFE